MSSTKEITQDNKKEFGLLSMIAMVMGIVIGSGIFAKNAGLIATNGSIYITFAAWIVGALLVLSIVVAFMELFTMTEKANEQSTYANWGRMLINSKFAKFAGIYFIFVNLPISIVTMTFFAGNRITDVLFVDTNVIKNTSWYFITRLGIVVLLLAYFFSVNGFFNKPGKYLQNIGTSVKVIPLLFVFVLFVGMLIFNADQLNPIFSRDFNEELRNASGVKNEGMSGLLVFAATMPAIIFVFDGFLTSGSLSKEAKSPNTYRMAVLIGILIVIFVYLTYSLGVFALGNPFNEDGTLNNNYGEINNAILNVWVNAQWLASLITVIVAISILTSVSGVMMSCIRGVADLSANNLIDDQEGKTLKRNKANALPGSMLYVLWMTIGYFFIIVSLDAIAIPSTGWNGLDSYHLTAGSDFLSNLTSVGSFIIMIVLIMAGLVNRKTNKVDSNKSKLFIPAAIIAIVTMVLILVIYVIQIFWFDPNALIGTSEYDAYVRMYTVQIISAVIWVVATPIIYVFMEYRLKKMDDSKLKEKEKLIFEYKNK